MNIHDSMPVTPIKLSEESRSKLSSYICGEIRHVLNERQGLEKKWKLWSQQAQSRRKREGVGPREAQIDVGLTTERLQQMQARLINPIVQQDKYFTCESRKPASIRLARDYEELIDWMWDRINAMAMMENWSHEFLVFPAGFVKTSYVSEITRVKRWVDIGLDDLVNGPLEIPLDEDVLEVGGKRYRESYVEVATRRGAFPEVVPIQDIIFPLYAESIETSPWIAQRVWLTKGELKSRVREGLYDDVVDKLGDPVERRELLSMPEGCEPGESIGKQYQIMEVYLEYELNKSDGPTEIIVVVDLESGVILRAVHNFYHQYVRPFVSCCYKRVNGSIYGIPMTFVLEPAHAAYSASFAQELDAASKANEVLILGPVGSDLPEKGFDSGRLKSGFYETTAAPTDFREFKMSQPYSTNPQLRQALVTHADRMIGMSDMLYGVEPVQRPTATGQVQLIKEASMPQLMLLENFRYALIEVCKHMVARERQFNPNGIELYKMHAGPEDESIKVFQWPDELLEESVIVETKVSGTKISREMRKQEVLALLDRMPQVYQVMQGLVQAAAQPGNPIAPVAQQMLLGYQTLVNEFMLEFEVPHRETLNPNLLGALNYGQMVAQQMGQMQQQIMQLQQRLATSGPQAPGAMGNVPPGVGGPQAPGGMGQMPAGPMPPSAIGQRGGGVPG